MTPENNYLVTEVMTAPPQKLQLMLIDAAIRSAERARLLWQEEDEARAAAALGRAREIVGHILAGLKRDAAPELVGKVAGVYLFLFRTLGEASLTRSEEKLDEAIRVLRAERETWRQLCEKLPAAAADAAPQPQDPPVPHLALDHPDRADSPGLSLEA